jgi:hypothetical protein
VASDRTARGYHVEHFFIISCRFSHAAADDPIVYPGKPGRSHEHAFVGNVSTSAFSTATSLRAHAKTTCNRAGDDSAYWAPMLYADGKAVPPREATIYYSRITTALVKPFPAGLRMVAGNAHAIAQQRGSVTSWECEQLKARAYAPRAAPPAAMEAQTMLTTSRAPYCGTSTNLELVVHFPNCSDGRVDSADHKSHMAYSTDGRCPASHPVAVPAIKLVFRYPPIDSKDVFLASGGVYSGHADFMNGWTGKAQTRLVNGCLNLRRVCGYPVEPGALN